MSEPASATATPRLQWFGQSDRGRIRSNNEDSAFAGARLIVVADGIGGLPAGAQRIAIRNGPAFGADHLRDDRRSRDRTREERFRDHGLEYVAVVRGELNRVALVVRRLRAAYSRALFLPSDRCRWTLEEPAWFRRRMAG